MKTISKPIKDLLCILQYIAVLTIVLLVVFFTPRSIFSPRILDIFVTTEKPLVLKGSPEFNKFLADRKATLPHIRDHARALDFTAVNLPRDLSRLPPQKRMSQFTALVLSQALKCNEKILKDRERLILFIEDSRKNRIMDDRRRAWYRRLAAAYAVPRADPQELLKRVDIVPVSLAIAQAITESGWGTSRFAQQGNALYGQHLPKSGKGKFILSRYGDVKVAAFDSILQATASYMHTINTSRAYSSLRENRHKLRQQGRVPDGYTLAEGLLHYSEIGEQYITDLRHLITTYRLEDLEKVTLNKEQPAETIRFTR